MDEGLIMVNQDNELLEELLCQARSGNRAGMGHLAVIVRERLYPFALRTTLDHDAAEDIIQETLLAVLREIGRLRENARFWPWAYRITWNKIQDHLRKSRLRSSGKASLAQNQSHNRRAYCEDPLEAQIRAERLREVSDGVDMLSYEHRDIIRLRFYEQLTYAQIASRTHMTAKVARARSYRAKQRLKTWLL